MKNQDRQKPEKHEKKQKINVIAKTFQKKHIQTSNYLNKLDKIEETSKAKSEVISQVMKYTDPQLNMTANTLSENDNSKTIKRFTQENSDLKQELLNLRQNFKVINEDVTNLKKDLELKSNQLARTETMYNNLVEKSVKQQKQIEALKMSIYQTTTKYKNQITSIKANKTYDQNTKNRKIETLQKMVNFYQAQYHPQGDTSENEQDLTKLIKFSEDQKEDLEKMNLIFEQKEQKHCNQREILLSRCKELQLQCQLRNQLCDMIEATIKNSIGFDGILYERCIKSNEENERLRIRLDQMNAQIKLFQTSKNQIKQYEQQLKNMIKEYSSRIVTIIQIQNQYDELKCQNQELNSKNNQQMQEIQELKNNLQTQKKETARIIEEQKASIEKYSQIVKELRKRQQKYKENNQQINTQNEQNNANPKFQSLLATSEIINSIKAIKRPLIEQIQKLHDNYIILTRRFYRQDEYINNFGNYFNGEFAFLILVKINDHIVFGAFSPSFNQLDKEGKPESAFLFTYIKGNKKKQFMIYGRNSRTKDADRNSVNPAVYADNTLVLGNNELMLRNNSKQRQLILNNNTFGFKYFEKIDNEQINQFVKENKVRYEQLEIHAVQFQYKFNK